VPVGAGRRKNKNSSAASQHRTIVISAPPNGLLHQAVRPNGSLLAFGSNSPLCESMPSTLNLVEIPQCYTPNGKENLGSLSNAYLAWNPIPWESRFPVSSYSTHPDCAQATRNLQWVSTPQNHPDQSSSTTSSNSSSLGKHARDGTLMKVSSSNNNEKHENQRLVTPKTLRIHDPTEAAKSSIWDTLGIKNEKVCSSNGGGFFKGLHQSKDAIDHERSDPSMVLQANPAAFSRSMTFHESAHPSC